VLVLLMGGMKGAVEIASCDMIYIPSFMTMCSGIQGILRLFTLTILQVAVSV
jgi:hypothetical protein